MCISTKTARRASKSLKLECLFRPIYLIVGKCPAALGDGTWYYESFTDSCFFVSTASDTWENAENACNAKQAHLASVNFDQQLFLTTVLSRYAATDAHFWIGLRLEDPVTRQHMWVNGDTTRYRNWDNNEPNSNGLEACVTIGNRNGKWKDDYCLRQFKYVCMAANSPVNTTEAPVQETWGCPDNCTGCVVFRKCLLLMYGGDTGDGFETCLKKSNVIITYVRMCLDPVQLFTKIV